MQASLTEEGLTEDSKGDLRLPIQVQVKSLVSTRYPSGVRPASWDKRVEGVDTVSLTDGRQIKLHSDGGQSPPQPGWKLILTSVSENQCYRWTLYGTPAT